MGAPPRHAQAKHSASFQREHDLSWRDQARCLHTNPERFFATTRIGEKDAISFCLGCPVRLDCLGWAIRNNMADGIWGAATAAERKQIKRGRR